MTKKKLEKISNKQRDSAITHLMQRLSSVEYMSQSIGDLLENYVIYKEGSKDKFIEYLQKIHKERLDEQEKSGQKDGKTASSDKENARQRAERIRSKKRRRPRKLQKSS